MIRKRADGSDKSHGEDFHGITEFEVLSPDLFPGSGGSRFQCQFVVLLTDFTSELFALLFQRFQRNIGTGFLENADRFVCGVLCFTQNIPRFFIRFAQDTVPRLVDFIVFLL